MIKLVNVSKKFDSGRESVEAVKNVTLELEQGKITGFIGSSGAGKSTLVRCMNLLERPTEGKVYVDEVELTALPYRELLKRRKKIGMIFQHFNLFSSRTVYQNIAYPLKHGDRSKEEIREKVKELLELVGLSDKWNAYPSELSGGQKQRVAIARALANDPDILLSDEATSALDPQTTKAILSLLKEVNQRLGITIVVITHEMQVIKDLCDYVVVMEKGEVVEQGEVFDIFSSPCKKITREFVESTTNLWKIYDLLKENGAAVNLKPGDRIIRFRYRQRNASEALVSKVSREYGLNVNIIFGNIEIIGDSPIGGLVAVVSGRDEDIMSAVEYLENKNVGIEVIKNGVA